MTHSVTTDARTEAFDKIKSIVGPKGWTDDPARMAPYLVEPRGLFQGATQLIVFPANTAEVAAVVGVCHTHDLPVVPQGGNTGLCGGGLPLGGGHEIIVNLSRMNRVRALDPLNYTMTVEAGCILAALQHAADQADRLFPLSMASEGSCEIGGNLSTNAGGVGVLRYGNTRDLVLGLEVVLPDGRIWNGLTGLRKDNTGYDLKHLFIGAEGTLGIITAAVCKLFPKPRDIQTALVALASPGAAITLLARARDASGDGVTAFELMPRIGIDFVLKHTPGTRDPLDTRYDWYALIEFSSAQPDGNLRAALESLLETGFEDGEILDGVIAENERQRGEVWKLREAISDAQGPEGGSIKHDISVPVSHIASFIERASAAVSEAIPGIRVVAFGHIGDGNVHFNLSQPVGADKAAYLAEWDRINRIVHDIVADLDGSISAEHGIGLLKVEELAHYKSPVELEIMRAVKSAIDPKGLMNPGKILPALD